MYPGHTDTITGFEFCDLVSASPNPTHNLMAQNHGQSRRGRAAFDFIQLGMTHAAGGNFYQDLVVLRNRLRQIL
jgi:hypothetical protein